MSQLDTMEQPTQDLDKTLDGITSEKDEWKKWWLKHALAGIMNFLPDTKKSGKDIPNASDLQSAMVQRIDADTSAPDIAKNPQVKAIKEEMMRRIHGEADPSRLLENYAQMRGMLDGAIWANEWAQAQSGQQVQRQSADQQKQNDLAQLDFTQLGKKFRDSIDQANRARVLDQNRAAADARAASYTEARSLQSWAAGRLGAAFQRYT